ncbi:sulfatase family protein [Aquimarina sp. 433]
MNSNIYRILICLWIVTWNTSCKRSVQVEVNNQNIIESSKSDRPNIVLILCDDLGYSDVGFNGSEDIKTPELDALASNGIIFSSAYVAHPFCGPSRAALMTGRYPHQIGSQYNLPRAHNNAEKGISLQETFISKVLQQAGYYTGAIGKWHLGTITKYHPNNRGFDDFYGFLGGGHNYFPEQFKAAYQEQKDAGNTEIWDYITPLEYNGAEVDENEYITDALSREASKFVNKASEKESPFFLYLSYNAPHTPLEAKEEDLKVYAHIKDEKRKTYAAMVHAVDRGVGQLINTLEKTEQLENTLIVFLSDNGGRTDQGGNNFPLRGRKGNTSEGGIRVPMFFHWPKKITKGKTFDYPVSALDFYPTFAGLAKIELPDHKIVDGKDIWSDLIVGGNPRKGAPILTLRHRKTSNEVGVRLDHWKAYKPERAPWKLYDIEKDIGEENDISNQHPDILKELIEKSNEWAKTHSDPEWFHDEETEENWYKMKMPKFEETFKLN